MKELHTILCAVDFTPAGRAALADAVDLAREYQAQLIAAHIVEPVDYPPEYGLNALRMADAVTGLLDKAERALAACIAEADPGPARAIRQQVVFGHAAETLCALAADTHADLLVVGTRGLRGARHLLHSQTAEHLVRHAPCPVWTTRVPSAAGSVTAPRSNH